MADAPGERLLQAVARLHRWATRHAELEVSPAQARLLALMNEVGPARVGDLAEADHCSQPTMTAQVQRLQARGWAEREPDPTDGRASLVRLTSAGSTVLRRARKALAAVVSPLLADLTPHEQQVIDEAVAILTRLVERDAKP